MKSCRYMQFWIRVVVLLMCNYIPLVFVSAFHTCVPLLTSCMQTPLLSSPIRKATIAQDDDHVGHQIMHVILDYQNQNNDVISMHDLCPSL